MLMSIRFDSTTSYDGFYFTVQSEARFFLQTQRTKVTTLGVTAFPLQHLKIRLSIKYQHLKYFSIIRSARSVCELWVLVHFWRNNPEILDTKRPLIFLHSIAIQRNKKKLAKLGLDKKGNALVKCTVKSGIYFTIHLASCQNQIGDSKI